MQNSAGREGVSSLFSHTVFTVAETKDVSPSGRACCQSRRTNIISYMSNSFLDDRGRCASVSDLINIRGSLQTHRVEYGIIWVM